MPNDSSTGGYLLPVGAAPPSDAALDAILQPLVVGTTGLPGPMVRPRWQPTEPKQPEPNINWCAIGVIDFDPQDYPVELHDAADDGSTTLREQEQIRVMASFYGPNAQANAKALRRALYIAQNREVLQAQGMDVTEVMRVTAAGDLVNQQWVRRYDLTVVLQRSAETTYPILNLLSASPEIGTGEPS